MIELYAVTDDPSPPAPPLRALPCAGLTALVAPAGPRGEVTPDELWRHEAVIEALMEDRDLLPVRFGTRLADDEAVAVEIGARREQLALALERVRGAVELAVRAVGPGESADGVHATLLGAARASRRLAGPELLRAAYLVDRDAVPAFARAVESLQRPGLGVLCTGPWPPYSFTEAP